MNKDLYEVERPFYVQLIKSIVKGTVDIKENFNKELNEAYYQIYSKKTGKCICERIANEEGEKYYIYEALQEGEGHEPEIRQKVILDTPEQVQILFDYIKKRKEEEANGRTI